MLWNVWTQSPEEKTISMYVFSLAEKNSTIINMTCLRFLHTKRKKWEEPHSGCLSSRPRVKDKQTKALESMRRTSAFHRSWGLSSHPCGPKAMWELKGKGQGLGPFFFFFFLRRDSKGQVEKGPEHHMHSTAPWNRTWTWLSSRRGLLCKCAGPPLTSSARMPQLAAVCWWVSLASPGFLEKKGD